MEEPSWVAAARDCWLRIRWGIEASTHANLEIQADSGWKSGGAYYVNICQFNEDDVGMPVSMCNRASTGGMISLFVSDDAPVWGLIP